MPVWTTRGCIRRHYRYCRGKYNATYKIRKWTEHYFLFPFANVDKEHFNLKQSNYKGQDDYARPHIQEKDNFAFWIPSLAQCYLKKKKKRKASFHVHTLVEVEGIQCIGD